MIEMRKLPHAFDWKRKLRSILYAPLKVYVIIKTYFVLWTISRGIIQENKNTFFFGKLRYTISR